MKLSMRPETDESERLREGDGLALRKESFHTTALARKTEAEYRFHYPP